MVSGNVSLMSSYVRCPCSLARISNSRIFSVRSPPDLVLIKTAASRAPPFAASVGGGIAWAVSPERLGTTLDLFAGAPETVAGRRSALRPALAGAILATDLLTLDLSIFV